MMTLREQNIAIRQFTKTLFNDHGFFKGSRSTCIVKKISPKKHAVTIFKFKVSWYYVDGKIGHKICTGSCLNKIFLNLRRITTNHS